jgi:hypothetical protein
VRSYVAVTGGEPDNRAFYRLVFSDDATLPFRAVLEDFLAKRTMARLAQVPRRRSAPSVPDTAIAAFAVGAGVSLLAWWVNSDFALSQEAMAAQMTILIMHGAYSGQASSTPTRSP